MPLFIAFSDKGFCLAERLCASLGGKIYRGSRDITIYDFARLGFESGEDLVFVGAVGIAVRAVAPFCRAKTCDPAVVAVDECAHFAVPLLSGHLGGANELARRISSLCGAQAVITTATDANGIFAVDEWARVQGLRVLNPEKIKIISSSLLAGKSIKLFSAFPLPSETPQGIELSSCDEADVIVDIRKHSSSALTLIPKICVLGVGCRKGADPERMQLAFESFMDSSGIYSQAVSTAASIDLKQNEAAVLELCKQYYFNFTTFTAAELAEAEGIFEGSEFVERVTGVNNVCGRAAAKLGKILVPKTVCGGMTFALSVQDIRLDWRPFDGK